MMPIPVSFGRSLFTTLFLSTYFNGILGNRVSVHLGLDDADAIVGKIFRYTIPKDAFRGDVDRFEITEAGGTSLPRWLVWNQSTSTLSGVPGEDDLGPNYVQVTAIGYENDPNLALNTLHTSDQAKDIFSIHVYDEYRLPTARIPFDERLSCDEGPAIAVTLTLDTVFNSLSAAERMEIIRAGCKVFDISDGAMRLFSNSDETFTSLKRIIQLASSVTPSPDDGNDAQLSSAAQAVLTWRLSCEPWKSPNDFEKTIEQVQVGQPVGRTDVVSWYVAEISYEPHRRKRQGSYVTPNSYLGPTGPTSEVETTTSVLSTRSTTPAKTTTIRVRPTGFATTDDLGIVSRTSAGSTSVSGSASSSSSTTTRTRATTQVPRVTVRIETFATKKPGDEKPTLKNGLGTLRCHQNRVCYIPIPSNTFYDVEDGDTTKLKLHLEALGDNPKQFSWLQLDEKRQLLIGLPTDAGSFLFRLTATDSGNRQISDAFSVTVEEDALKEDKLHHRLFMHFTVSDPKNFTSDVRYRIAFLEKLARYFGDSTAEKIRLNSLSEDNFVLSWSNISLPVQRCTRSELKYISSRLFRDGGQVRAQFKTFMNPPFAIQKGRVEFSGVCADLQDSISTQKPTVEGVGAVATSGTLSPTFGGTNATAATTTTVYGSASPSKENLFISTILPLVIIVVFVIVATLVACLLYRKNRQHKKGRAESKSEFVSKGAPIIFPDEVDPDKESTAATPMLLKDEKPPLQPLEFSVGANVLDRSNGNGAGHGAQFGRSGLAKAPSSGPGRALGKTHVSEAETELWQRPLLQDADENPLYRPPPAFEPAGLKENRSPRPKHASPQQRDPPPYVPP